MKKLPTFIGSIIVIFWLIMIGLLIRKHYFAPVQPEMPVELIENPIEQGEEWSGIYFKNEKTGYTVSRRQKTESGYYFTDEVIMDVSIMNVPQRLTTVMYSKTDQNLLLRTFHFVLRSGVIEFSVSGEVAGNQLHLKINTGGKVQDKSVVLSEIPVLENSLKFQLVKTGLSPGVKIKRTVFDPMSMASRTIAAEVEGQDEIFISGTACRCYRIKQTFNGIIVNSWINADGETIKEESPMGFVIIKEPKEVAITGISGSKTNDIRTATGIKINRPINNNNLSYLKIRLKNITFNDFILNGGRQKLEDDVVKIIRENMTDADYATIPISHSDVKDYLQATTFIQSESPEICTLVNAIVKKEKNALKVINLLRNWVSVNIDKIPTLSIPSALEVLRTRRGDCNEHAVLFAALCRAAGIPAKTCAGIVYLNGSFFYHAWNDVYINRWITIDPVMNQFPADVTHVKFVEGDVDKQIAMVRIVGKLAIDVLEYR